MSLAALMSSKACIIPTTVPKNPIIGAVAIHKDIQVMFFSIAAISIADVFSIDVSASSTPNSAFEIVS